MPGLRRRTYEVLDMAVPGDRSGVLVNGLLMALIVLNVAAFIAGTVRSVEARFGAELWAFEVLSVAVFSAEYLLRLWSCVEDPRYSRPVLGRLRWAGSFMALVDLASVLPFYISFLGLEGRLDARVVRVVRLLRIFRIAKLGRYSTALQTLARVARAKRAELVATISLIVLLLVIASSAIYFAEKDVPQTQFTSIPASMWWAIVTLATVGYGDVVPMTVAGRIIGGFVAILGIGLFALPTGILGSGFMEDIQRRRAEEAERAKAAPPAVCPHCGKELPKT
ncbi:MAG TPA: ion transporter [Planctomycetota bacterium]|nr:ion transporter [Planctomycetota bacterium]